MHSHFYAKNQSCRFFACVFLNSLKMKAKHASCALIMTSLKSPRFLYSPRAVNLAAWTGLLGKTMEIWLLLPSVDPCINKTGHFVFCLASLWLLEGKKCRIVSELEASGVFMTGLLIYGFHHSWWPLHLHYNALFVISQLIFKSHLSSIAELWGYLDGICVWVWIRSWETRNCTDALCMKTLES